MRKLVLAFQCDLRWDQLEGTARARHCTACNHAVHNLSALTAREASALLADNDGRLCVRYACDETGDIVFQPEPRTLRSRARGVLLATALPLTACVQDATASDAVTVIDLRSGAASLPVPAEDAVPQPAPAPAAQTPPYVREHMGIPPIREQHDPSATMRLYVQPNAQMTHDGLLLSTERAPHLALKRRGTITIGDASTPFKVTLRYRTKGGLLSLSIDTQPRAIIALGEEQRGQTPLHIAEVPESTQRITLERADGQRMKIMFRVDRDGF